MLWNKASLSIFFVYNSLTERIDKLCEFLDDAASTMITGPEGKTKGNLKLCIFQLNQRIEDQERKLFSLEENYNNTMIKDDLVFEQLTSRISSNQKSAEKQGVYSEIKGSLKSILTKHELTMNNFNIRIAEVESYMQRLMPDSIRNLIKNIAEVIIDEEKKEVND